MSILHTVVPLELVLGAPGLVGLLAGAAGDGAPAAQGAVETVALGGERFLEVQPGPLGATVVRLHSPRPADYLDRRYQPGALWTG